MSGDHSRDTFDPKRHFSAVLMQQGRVALDADWNELVAIVERRLRAGTVDVIGRCVVPRETPDGFRIEISGTGNAKTMTVGRGRLYAHGLLAENHGDPPGRLDLGEDKPDGSGPLGVLAEEIGTAPVPYDGQPHFPDPPALPAGNGPHLVYLDVWQRKVGAVEDERLLDKALGGVDTTTRWQTVWQVKVLEDVGAGVTCATPDAEIEGWSQLTAPSAGLLTTEVLPVEDPDEPCVLPPGGGYSGLENQLYRVEIHDEGPAGTATFKWSRDNASVVTAIESFSAPDTITVARIGRDDVLRLNKGDWVEVTDDRSELRGEPGVLRRVDDINEELREVVLSSGLPADLVPSGAGDDTARARHSRVRRWDQNGEVRDTGGNLLADLGDAASGGVIPITAAGVSVVLERNVKVTFALRPAGGRFRAMDHWTFAARTADRSVEELVESPPRGIHHHYCRLSVVTFPGTVNDCRTFWPPEFGGEACGCSVCVTAESHNSGALTIQQAVDMVRDTGGTVCLGAGDYRLGGTPVVLDGARSVRVLGQGYRTTLSFAGAGPAVTVRNCVDVRVEDLAVVAVPSGGGDQGFGGALLLHNCVGVRVRGLVALVLAVEGTGVGIGLAGYLLGVDLRENALMAPHCVAGVGAGGVPTTHVPYLLLFDLAVRDNTLAGQHSGIALGPFTLHMAGTRLAGNTVFGCDVAGISALGVPADGGHLDVAGNTVLAMADGIRVVTDGARVRDNDVSAWPDEERERGSGIALVEGIGKDEPASTIVAGNRVTGVRQFGIHVAGRAGALLIKQNVVRGTGDAAIFMDVEASATDLVVENNVLTDVARAFEDRDRAVAAVRVHSAGTATVAGNRIQRVATDAPLAAYRAGIDVAGCPVVSVRDNTIGTIGPPEGIGDTVGVRVQAPFGLLQVAGNAVRQDAEVDQAIGPWYALRVAGVGLDGVERAADLKAPFFVLEEGLVHAFTGRRVRVADFGRERRAGITANQFDAAGTTPVVEVTTGFECVLAGNQCALTAFSQAPAAVVVRAERIVASNNTVRRPTDEDAVHLFPNERSFTVLGNITFGNIRVMGGALPGPWDALNVIAP